MTEKQKAIAAIRLALIISIPVLLVLLFAGCPPKPKNGLIGTGFALLPFASDSYKVGHIVEISSSPRKVEITYTADFPWDRQLKSRSWDISSRDTQTVKSTFSAQVINILKAHYDHASEETIDIQLTNTKMATAEKYFIHSTLKEHIEKNVALRNFLNAYIKDGTRFSVVTATLTADISFSIEDPNGRDELVIDSEVIKKLNSKFDFSFKRDTKTKRVIAGKELVVGIQFDEKIVGLILKNKTRALNSN